jgi:hypothetical protein
MGNLATPTNGLELVPGTHFSATVDLPSNGTLYIGTGGNLKCTLTSMTDGTFITYKNIPDGCDFPRNVKRIHPDSTVTDVILDI